jgi:hypothetical protein
MNDAKDIEKAIDNELRDLCRKIEAKLNYKPTVLMQMIDNHGGRETIKRLIDRPEPSPGYKKLAKLNELDFTVEVLLLDHIEWHSLFKEKVLLTAIRRVTKSNKDRKLALQLSHPENTI